MIATVCSALAVVFAGAALRPRPVARRPGGHASTTTGRRPRAGRMAPLARLRRTEIDPFEVASWCEGLARALRGGSTLAAAIRSTTVPASLRADVDRIVLALDRGVAVGQATPFRSSSPHIDVATLVIRACALHGGSAAEPLDRAAATLRARAADEAERRAQSAQARLSAIVMTILPIAMLTLLLVTSSATRTAVASTPGLVAVALGATLNLAGWAWMRRSIAGVAR